MNGLRCTQKAVSLGCLTNQDTLPLPRGGRTVAISSSKPISVSLVSKNRGVIPRERLQATVSGWCFRREIALSTGIQICRVAKDLVGESQEIKMPGAMVDADYDKFDSVLKTAEVQGVGTLLLLFLANRDSSLGKSWCPDCVRAEPVIYKVVDGAEKPVTLLRVYVGDRPTWWNPEHPLRKDSRFALKGVPTLVKWENGGIAGRLEDHEAHVEEKT
ncbi:hypothetical protein R1flu_010080 [Riccia fluitans]|uniref:Thioredoxin domain-containing protein n=1 Tax=Riccia fluitans TaxID=41844 RepID=A0ABD1Z3Z3_9MARC